MESHFYNFNIFQSCIIINIVHSGLDPVPRLPGHSCWLTTQVCLEACYKALAALLLRGQKLGRHVASNHPNYYERSSYFYITISRYIDHMVYIQEKSYNQINHLPLFLLFFPLFLCQKISPRHIHSGLVVAFRCLFPQSHLAG